MEPTLALKVDDLKGEIGIFAGWGRDPANWDDEQKDILDSCVRSGLRSFYFPPADANGYVHVWSFLKPFVSLTLASGGTTVALPDDFGGVEGQVLIESPTNSELTAIDFRPEGYVRKCALEAPDFTGPPMMCAVVPLRGTTLDRGQRFQLLFFPTADAAYTLMLQYYLVPDALTGNRPWYYGGPVHAETVLESCKAAFETQQDDQDGLHRMLFKERLAASIDQDQKFKPQKLGIMGDKSDDIQGLRSSRWHNWPTTTLAGVTPE